MQTERRCVPRRPFVAAVQATDLESGVQLTGDTGDLSLFGCFMNTPTPFSHGTKLSLRIAHGGTGLAALGRVAYARSNQGMGIVFSSIEPDDQTVLDEWLAEVE
jgi:hypothetical protein